MPEDESFQGEANPKAPDLPDTSDLNRRLAELGRGTRPGESASNPWKGQSIGEQETQRKDALTLGRGLQIAYVIVGIPLVGFIFGSVVDNWAGTNCWKGYIGLAGCVAGVVIALYLIKQANASSKF